MKSFLVNPLIDRRELNPCFIADDGKDVRPPFVWSMVHSIYFVLRMLSLVD